MITSRGSSGSKVSRAAGNRPPQFGRRRYRFLLVWRHTSPATSQSYTALLVSLAGTPRPSGSGRRTLRHGHNDAVDLIREDSGPIGRWKSRACPGVLAAITRTRRARHQAPHPSSSQLNTGREDSMANIFDLLRQDLHRPLRFAVLVSLFLRARLAP